MTDKTLAGIIIMLLIMIGLMIVVMTCIRVVLNKFKSDKIKGLEFDLKVTLSMLLILDSMYIRFFTQQFLTYRRMEFAPIISYLFLLGVMPFNLISSIICGIKGKKLLYSTLLGTAITIVIFIIAIGII